MCGAVGFVEFSYFMEWVRDGAAFEMASAALGGNSLVGGRVSFGTLGGGRWKMAQFNFRGIIFGAFVMRFVFRLPEENCKCFVTQLRSLSGVKHFFCEGLVMFIGLVLLRIVGGASATRLLS